MVAGSHPGNARGCAGGLLPLSPRVARAWSRQVILLLRQAGDWPALAALYLLAAAALLLPWPFGTHPAWAFNWEGYTAWRWMTYWEPPAGPAVEIWAPTDGLMTDSGQGPLVGVPMAIGVALGGVSLEAMRVPVALLAAAAVPLLWLLGRRVVGPGPATLAALLLATSPVYLLYGRTATLVGVSLAPLLLSTLALARVLDAGADGWRWQREGLLAGSLLLGIYAYAPVRLLWPLAIVLLGLAAIRHPARRGSLLRLGLLCVSIVPAATMTLEQLAAPDPNPVAAAAGYFHARGEQLVAMSDDPAQAGQYLREMDGEGAAGWSAAVQLVGQNAADLARLLLDRDTVPAPIEFWNERGRFWPWFLFPFAVIGAISTARKGLPGHVPGHGEERTGKTVLVRFLPLALCLGLALPLLLTSRVHVGRLLPALPFAFLIAAAGAWDFSGWLAGLARRAGADAAARWIAPALAGALLLPAAAAARVEMEAPVAPSRDALTIATLADWQDDAGERGGAVLVEDPALGDDIERVHAATYRIGLDRVYRFVDVQEGMREGIADPRPALLWRGALGALEAGEIVRPCERLWFVTPEIAGEFFATWRAVGCTGAPDSVILP